MAGREHAGRRGRPPRGRRAGFPALILPEELDAASCTAQLIGKNCVMVENHCGLCVLSRERIVVRTKCGPLSVCGCNLSLSEVRPDAMVVRGEIARVGYLEDGDA